MGILIILIVIHLSIINHIFTWKLSANQAKPLQLSFSCWESVYAKSTPELRMHLQNFPPASLESCLPCLRKHIAADQSTISDGHTCRCVCNNEPTRCHTPRIPAGFA